MGFNPHLKQKKSPWDFVMVGSALLITAGLVIWAIIG